MLKSYQKPAYPAVGGLYTGYNGYSGQLLLFGKSRKHRVWDPVDVHCTTAILPESPLLRLGETTVI